MRCWAAVLALVVLCTATGHAETPEGCGLPNYLLFGDAPLSRLAASAAKTKRLEIAVLGTASSTLSGTDGLASSYPARLGAELKRQFPNFLIKVTNHAKARQSAGDMAASIARLLTDQKPNLVIWQTGTFEALRGSDPEAFRAKLADGVGKLQNGGADVILMDAQYSPRTESIIALTPYVESMRWVAREREVPLFDRLAIMRYWYDTGAVDLYAATKDFAIAKKVHDCLGRALAAMIVDAAQLRELGSKTP